MVKYGIRRTSDGALAYMSSTANDGEFCVSVAYEISFSENDIIYMKDKETAEKVISNNTPWYNAGSNTPEWGYDFKTAVEKNDIEIVKITMMVDTA